MKRISWWLLLLGLAACSGSSESDVTELTKRVSQLEKKVKSLEQANKGKKPGGDRSAGGKPGGEKGTRPGGGAGEGEAGQLATLKAEGDAAKVILAQGKKRFKIPGKAPAGAYKIMAAFGEEPLAEAGEVEVEAKKTVTVNCTAAAKSCTTSVGG